mmetsp:Transcript_17768/g.45743  ORF Transcript_17768/g.45743 Transcript_17768/m.45743 type:complete len:359 (+) Transcript_17768:37-1113(+)
MKTDGIVGESTCIASWNEERALPVIDLFYEVLCEQYQEEEARLTRAQVDIPQHKRRRYALYADDSAIRQFKQQSVRALKEQEGAAREWLSDSAIYAAVALQHFLEADIRDLGLEQAQRLNIDTFTEDGVNQQMIMDVTRSKYRINGQAFSLMDELEREGEGNSRAAPTPAPRIQSFRKNVVEALKKCLLGAGPMQGELLRVLSTQLSQSGLANIARACVTPQIVVSGGHQLCSYEVSQVSEAAWEVSLTGMKSGFTSYMVTCGIDLDPDPHPCAAASKILQSAVLRFSVQGTQVLGCVVDIEDNVAIIDEAGQQIPLERFPAPPVALRLGALRAPEEPERTCVQSAMSCVRQKCLGLD